MTFKRRLRDFLISMGFAAGAFSGVLVIYFLTMLIGRPIETRFFPAFVGFTPTDISVDGQFVSFRPVINKLRECKFAGADWFATFENGIATHVDLTFPEDSAVEHNNSAPVGTQKRKLFKIRQGQYPDATGTYGVIYHSCHSLFGTEILYDIQRKIGPYPIFREGKS